MEKKLINILNLKGKKVIIVGGSGQIGLEIVKLYLKLEAKIIVLDIKKPKIKENNNLIFFKANVSNILNFEKFYSKILKKYWCPDIYINSSYPKTSQYKNSSFEKINYKSFKENLEAHLNSYAWLSKITANEMKKRKISGSILNLSSIYGVVGQDLNIYKNVKNMRENFTYSAIKGAIVNLTRQMASYYGKYNIRVNCISPGGVKNINQNKIFIKNYSKKVPLNRLADAKEIAPAVVFLSSDEASYITGINLLIDGGWTSI